MRYIKLLLIATLALPVMFMTSCEDVTTDKTPLLTITSTGLGANNSITEGDTFSLAVNAGENPDTKSKLDQLVIAQPGADTTVIINASTFAQTFSYVAPAAGMTETYIFTLTAKDGEAKGQTITVTGEAPVVVGTPLGAATAFSWEKCGAINPDLSTYGLTWDGNGVMGAALFAVIQNAGSKFVELAASDWTSLTTAEELAAAVDAASAITGDYEDLLIDINGGTIAYDKVFGTLNGGTYTLIHVTETEQQTGTCAANGGNTSFIKGETKQ